MPAMPPTQQRWGHGRHRLGDHPGCPPYSFAPVVVEFRHATQALPYLGKPQPQLQQKVNVPVKPAASYLICTVPRSGSWLLSEGLENTAIAGYPREYFGLDYQSFWVNRLGITGDADYMEKILAAGTTPNGVFGAKIHWSQFEWLVNKLQALPEYRGLATLDLLSVAFPDLRYIWLRRADKIRQAISYYRAIETNRWWQRNGGGSAGSRARKEPTFDAERIETLENMLVTHEAHWQRYFDRCRSRPLIVTYESITDAYATTVRAILDGLQIPIPDDVVLAPPPLEKQADAMTEDWVQRYVASKRSSTVQVGV